MTTDEGRATLRRNLEAAVASYRRALALDPGLAEAHRGLGLTLKGLGRPREAGQELVTYLKARPNAPDRPLVVDELKEITATLKEETNR